MPTRYLLVVAAADEIAERIGAAWGTPPSSGDFVEGSPVRQLSADIELLRRPGLHVEDSSLGQLLPERLRGTPIVFPSRHRSESGTPCLTVHPLGNLGPQADVGGEPFRLVPPAARLMADALRGLAEPAAALGIPATYEATHHGPLLHQPAFFVEIAESLPHDAAGPAARAVAELLRDLTEDEADRVAIGVGGGHYAPHFTELAFGRHWAFSHLIPRHALAAVTPEVLHQLREGSPPPEGALFQRAMDAEAPEWRDWGRRLRDGDATPRPTGQP